VVENDQLVLFPELVESNAVKVAAGLAIE